MARNSMRCPVNVPPPAARLARGAKLVDGVPARRDGRASWPAHDSVAADGACAATDAGDVSR